MARFGGPKTLTCFYCGKRSRLKFERGLRDFLCLNCDATNYLDENGEITDPPVATEREAAPTATTQYALPKPSTSSSIDSVFCETCLKNQRLFTASLAQYFPDDPSHPDYDELDRNYYRYRRNLEKRYPQVCEDCEGRVQEKIRQAGYTAKTDHLRRMMDRSRGRVKTGRLTALGMVNAGGRWLWMGGLLAQLLWHLVNIAQVLGSQEDGMYDPEDRSAGAMLIGALQGIAKRLPGADSMIRMSIAAGILSAWWNPHFVQVNRGFTRHLVGLTQWYSFQGLIIIFRVIFRSVFSLNGGDAQSRAAQLSAHMVSAAVMCLVYVLAAKSIKVDTTPLFRTETPKIVSPPRKKAPQKRKEEDSKTFSELFSEALDNSPAKTRDHNEQHNKTPEMSPAVPRRSDFLIAKLEIPREPVEISDEMDWSPSVPQHRAFMTNATTRSQQPRDTFNQPPIGKPNPFSPRAADPSVNKAATELHPPPGRPKLNNAAPGKHDAYVGGRGQHKTDDASVTSGYSSVSFSQPRFFAQEEPDDTNSLADLLGQSFNLGQGQTESSSSTSTGQSASTATKRQEQNNSLYRKNLQIRSVFVPLLLVMLPVWLMTSAYVEQWKAVVQGTILVITGAIALWDNINPISQTMSLQSNRQEQNPSLAEAAMSTLSLMEAAAVCWLGWELCIGRIDVMGYGAAVVGAVLLHQVWIAAKL